ncbi:hypothetical protein [Sediminicola arcticus]|jgi:hypothetical protein|uniref:Uncharacterized protein n=1 Tax=Sediminicola arcticus TaxID=1574308 RepID=A0ABV2SRF6_9FLAO
MKKKRVILFPENETISLEKEHKCQNELLEIQPGKIYRIGQPSNRYFEYIHPVIEPRQMSVKEFDDFKQIEGMVITVISILSMADGNRIAILRNYDNTPFIGAIEQIFANVDMSITSGEIMATKTI